MPACLSSTAVILVALAGLALPGCGSGRAPLGRVKGTVTLDGKPLAAGTVTFESAGRRPATGKVVAGEIVAVTTYQEGDGAPVGSHAVAVWSSTEAASAVIANPGEAKVGANYMSGKSLIPARYNDPSTSGLTAEIKAGDNTVNLALSSDAAPAAP